MFKTLTPYDQGQELALKYLWIVLQVTSNVVHDAFLILYSHLNNTDGGEKSIYQYCVENNRMPLYNDLLVDGYAEELFKGSPKNTKYFDLKVTRTLTESLIMSKFEGSSMSKVTKIMKDFTYLRNDLCHLELQSLGDREFKMKLQGQWETLKILYKLVCELTGRTFSSHVTNDLDSSMASLISSVNTKESKCKDCKGRDKISKGSRFRGTSQSSEDSGYFEPYQPTKHSAKEISGSCKITNTKRIMKEKWVQTLPPRNLAMKNAQTQVEMNKVNGLKVRETDICKTVQVSPKKETVSTATQTEASTDIHKNVNFTLNKHIPSTSSNPEKKRSYKSMKGTFLHKDVNKSSTSGVLTGGQEASTDHSHSFHGELPCYAEDSFKTHGKGSAVREEECFRREGVNFPQHGTNSKESKDTSTKPASGMVKRSSRASFKHSNMDVEQLSNSPHSTSFTPRKHKRCNRCAFFEQGKDAELNEATTSDQGDGIASRENATGVLEIFVHILQMLFICIVSCVIFCINVLVVSMYDLVDKVKRECRLRLSKNSIRMIIDAKTGLGQVAHVVQVQTECLVLLFHHPPIHAIPVMLHGHRPPIRVIPMMPHDHHSNLPRPPRFSRRPR